MDPDHVLSLFTDRVDKPDITSFIQTLFKTPDGSYDDLAPHTHPTWFLINYFDSACFRSLSETCLTNQNLLFYLKQFSAISSNLLETLNIELELQQKNAGFSFFDPVRLEKKVLMQANWNLLSKKKPYMATLLESFLPLPWIPFSYLCPLQLTTGPIIFCEPSIHLEKIPHDTAGKLFLFRTPYTFFQCLQFPQFVENLLKPDNNIHILSLFPENSALASFFKTLKKPIKINSLIAHSTIEKYFPFLEEAFREAYTKTDQQDREKEHWIYQIAKRALLASESLRLGKSRSLALKNKINKENWFDVHKWTLPSNMPLGPLPEDFIASWIEQGLVKRQPRIPSHQKKIRLMHVVPQISNENHAPTRLLTELCEFADRDKYEISVLATESSALYPLDYPYTSILGIPTKTSGGKTRNFLGSLGISCYINPEQITYWQAINQIIQFINEKEVDIVVFHGPDPINNLVSAAVSTPLRLFFDHGTLPEYSCYDAGIFSTEISKIKAQELPLKSYTLEFSLDVKASWEKEAYSKKSLHLPENSFVMTTISNHLENRISEEMVQAIAGILKRIPSAVYAPIGHIDDKNKWMQRFSAFGVEKRVFILGEKNNPSQCARSMDLYLNEFPFGSGLSMHDAMAAGCPVITMYDPEGPPQAQYGGIYFGIDRAIRSGKIDDYINLACRLATDRKLYEEWSHHAKACYEKRSDIRSFVRKFEHIAEREFKKILKRVETL